MDRSQSRPFVFAAVGALGFAAQIGVLHALVQLGVTVPLATLAAVLVTLAHNFLWHRRWTWRDRVPRATWHVQLLRFIGLNGAISLTGNVAITTALSAAGMPVVAANLAAVAICSLANFVAADRLVFFACGLVAGTGTSDAAVLEPKTIAAWNAYVAATESRIAREESKPSVPLPSDEEWRRLRAGTPILAQRTTTRGDGSAFDVPGGAVHHWRGRVFLPGVELDALLKELHSPTSRRWLPAEVVTMRVAHETGGALRVFMRLERDSVVNVTYDIEHAVRYTRHPGGHATSRSVSRHIFQVDAAGTPSESRRPEGDDLGFLWRLNAYWRYVPVTGGLLVECESLALSRNVPSMLRPIASPLVDRVSKESLESTLRALATGFGRRSG